MTDELTIEAAGLRKSYNSVPVVDGIDLAVPRGTVLALLGPNGAGKTTTVRMLATLTPPDGGTARVAGCDVVAQRSAARRRISLTGQYAALDELQTGTENLTMMGRLQGLSARAAHARTDELLERFDLVAAGRRRVATFSGGMRRRLDLAASLIRPPEVIFLDEPTTGLDPRSRLQMWNLVGELTLAGVTVLLTTQYLDEADRLADRIAVLDHGAIVAEGTAVELKATVGGQRLDVRCANHGAYEAIERAGGGAASAGDRGALTISIPFEGSAAAIRARLDELDPDRERIAEFSVRTASLDDVFMTLTGHTAATPESERTDD
ncbi:MAG TPA: ATP-binding cassette domain-containing protein [Solirubrobacteraceae bacterium]